MTNYFKATTVTALILSIAFLGTPRPVLAQTQSAPRTFTGSQIFRGLLFGEAPVSQLFPEVWASEQAIQSLDTKEKVIALNDLKKSVIADIISHDSTFMARFGQEMQSGDVLRIQAALDEAGQNTFSAMQRLGYLDGAGNPTTNLGAAQGDCLSVAVAAAVVVVGAVVAFAVILVAGAAAAVVIKVKVKKEKGAVTEEESQLYRETLINLMAERLYAPAP